MMDFIFFIRFMMKKSKDIKISKEIYYFIIHLINIKNKDTKYERDFRK